MPNIADSFTRADGPLGVADTGQAWTVRRGTVTVKGGRGLAANTSPGSYAVLDAGASGQDASISLTIGQGGGQAIVFREVDASNWWRLAQRHYSYSVQTGTQTLHYWTQSYSYYSTETGQLYATRQQSSSSSTTPPSFPSSVFVVGPDGANREFTKNGSPYVAYSQTSATYSTAYAYELLLERCQNGTLTRKATKALPAGASSLQVVFRSADIAGYVNGSTTASVTTSDATHAQATRHGFGYAETTQLGNTTGVDSFTVAPFNNPPKAPTVTVPRRVDLTQPFDITVGFNDDDQGDTPGASFVWLTRNGVVHALSRKDAVTTIRVPANLLTAGDWQVEAASRDAGGLPVGDQNLVRSAPIFISAAVPPPGPTQVSPVNGAVIPGESQVFVVAIENLDALQYRVVGDSGGLPDETVVIDPGGTVVSGDLRTFTAVGLPNSATVHPQFRAQLGGLWGPWTSTTHQVTFTPPAAPLASVLAVRLGTARGAVTDTQSVTAINPAPEAGQPGVAYNVPRRRLAAVGGDGIRVENPATGQPYRLPAGAWLDPHAPHGVELEYCFEAFAANGTSTRGPWSAGPITVDPTVPGGGPVDEGYFEDAYLDPAHFD